MADINNVAVVSEEGQKLLFEIRNAYQWKDKYPSTNQQFISEMSQLFISCQEHMTHLSSLSNPESQKEADALVEELITIRNHWGPDLFPQRMNALARVNTPHIRWERISY